MNNRTRILTVATQLFAARGYDAVGVQEIVEAAGITKPTLYHYFGSKHGLLNAILDENFAGLNAEIQPAVSHPQDLPNALNQLAIAYFKFASLHPLYYRMQLALWFAPPGSEPFQAVARINEQQQQTLETLFLQAAEYHGNLRGRHRAYAATFLGMLNTYIALTLNGYTELDEKLTYQAVHQFMHGIFS